jgi:hypothetical protein
MAETQLTDTGYGKPRRLSRGVDGFLGKPLDNVRFPDQLARILNGETVRGRAIVALTHKLDSF